MVVVLEELAHGEDVEGQRVARLVAVVEAAVAVAVPAPVDDGPVDGPHHPLHREQRPLPPMRGEEEVGHGIESAPAHPQRPRLAQRLVDELPLRIPAGEARLGLLAPVGVGVVAALGMEHHPQRVGEEARRVRVALGVGEGVVLPVQDGVGPRRKVRGPLHEIGEQMHPALGARAHAEHLVRGVPVVEEALEEDAGEPVPDEEHIDHEWSLRARASCAPRMSPDRHHPALFSAFRRRGFVRLAARMLAPPHSARSATAGSTRAARRAGSRLAASPTAPSTRSARTSERGSEGRTPKRRPA